MEKDVDNQRFMGGIRKNLCIKTAAPGASRNGGRIGNDRFTEGEFDVFYNADASRKMLSPLSFSHENSLDSSFAEMGTF